MPRLSQRTDRDRGAAVMMVLIFLGGGLLLGSLAIAVDVGAVFVERRELQNAADSAAIALAYECGSGNPACTTEAGAAALAQSLVDANSSDSMSNVSVCLQNKARFPGVHCVDMPSPLPEGNTYDCRDSSIVGTATWYPSAVRVYATSRSTSGDFIRSWFSGGDKATIAACAQAAWGRAGTGKMGLPIILPICDFRTSGTFLFREFIESNANPELNRTSCTARPFDGAADGSDDIHIASGLPGFALIDVPTDSGSCISTNTYKVGDVVYRATQANQLCASATQARLVSVKDRINFMPMSGEVSNQEGGSMAIRILSFAGFTLKAWYLSNQIQWPDPNSPTYSSDLASLGLAADWCRPPARCLVGNFTRGVIPEAALTISDGEGINTGAVALKLLP